MKTLADLKRDANSKKLQAKVVYWYGVAEESIPTRLKGWRKIVGSNSNSISFLTSDNKISKLYVERASLLEYDNNRLTVYKSGQRALNEAEQAAMNEWKKIEETEEYQKQLEYDMLTDYSGCYYRKKRFWSDRNMLYMMGYEREHGCEYDHNTGLVDDWSIKGDKTIEYELASI